MKNSAGQSMDPRRLLPGVSIILDHPSIMPLVERHSHALVVEAIRKVLDRYRRDLNESDSTPSIEQIVDGVEAQLHGEEFERLRPVVNATGIILHTNLGRAVLPQNAVDALAQLNRCCNLQVDLETGQRGKRNYMATRLLTRLTGAEAATIVNNNAAATFLILSALCEGREVVVSRGQLIEIGGSFRLPDCIHQSGSKMVEVGTTNKTHLRDYEGALTENTAALLRVNPSNYRIIGFTKEVPVADLVTLKKKRPDVLVIDDLGCGALVDLSQYGLPKEPTVQDSVKAGADIVCFSGDKLIGGPQAGIIVGKKALIEKIKKHPLSRMLRVGKMTDLVLEHTLRLFLTPEKLLETNPTLRMIAMPAKEVKAKAEALRAKLLESLGETATLTVKLREVESATGGGSLPDTPIPSWGLSVVSSKHSAERLVTLLRHNEPPIIARIEDEEVVLDVRMLMDGEDEEVAGALKRM